MIKCKTLNWALATFPDSRRRLVRAVDAAGSALTMICTLAAIALAGLPTAAFAQAVRFPTATLPGITDKALINATIYKPGATWPSSQTVLVHVASDNCGRMSTLLAPASGFKTPQGPQNILQHCRTCKRAISGCLGSLMGAGPS